MRYFLYKKTAYHADDNVDIKYTLYINKDVVVMLVYEISLFS
jgi:hypothetical protein